MIARLWIDIEITVVYDTIAGFHPLQSAGIDLAIIAFAVEMLFFTIQNVGKCCDTPVRVCAVPVFLYGFIRIVLTGPDMIQEHEGTYRIGVTIGQYPFD